MINVSTCRNSYTAGAGNNTYAYQFRIFAATDLLVLIDGVQKDLGVHYTVSGVGLDGGGSVTFLAGVLSGAGGELIIILSVSPMLQQVDLQDNNNRGADTLETMTDRVVRLCQELKEAVGRALLLEITSELTGLTVPDPVSGALLKWKADLSGLENYVAAFPGGNPGDNFDWGTGPPIAGTFAKPWIRFNSDHQLGDPFAWVLITDGTPGVWAEVGFVSANPA